MPRLEPSGLRMTGSSIIGRRRKQRSRLKVYPRRFERRKTGKTGYQPVCANEWVEGVCEKPRIKCTDCTYQRFLSVADEAIRWHISGRDHEGKDSVMGTMLRDETYFLFDSEAARGPVLFFAG
jgi:hypothetical protein